jgi:hypothetical protein
MKDFTRVGRIEPQALANAAATQKTNNSVLVSMVTAIGIDAIHKIFQFNSEKNCLNTDNKRTSLVTIDQVAH